MVLDASLLNTQQDKLGIKGKVEQSREMSSTQLGVVAIEKWAFRSLTSTKVANFTIYMYKFYVKQWIMNNSKFTMKYFMDRNKWFSFWFPFCQKVIFRKFLIVFAFSKFFTHNIL